MTNAFEKHSQRGEVFWNRPVVPAAIENRVVLHVVGPHGYASTGTALNDPSSVINSGTTNPPIGGLLKRIMDIVIACPALVLAAPVMILVGLLIKLTAGGPAIFSHSRVGFGGKPFDCYKFRSMVANSDEVLKTYLDANPEARKEWVEAHKIRNDPRVTFFGRMLRKSSLDELPQLINILRGDMSCVGPRPIVEDELRRYGEHQAEYLGTRPGLTGLWQVSGRSSLDYENRVALDSQYVQNWSIWLDLVILLRTIVAVMRVDRAS
ncbi:MAG TPA: sugar transferase [Mesorhizobium sp.]|jgi:exopolysaccharide production protein ExoY|uniref:sugar transferase n=1 Tax=Mesorhizobium sp. TaxID=1871066 RepID=UPI002DDD1F6C|nr:sugar transferase [Mesorhizobium sp.]HEV2501692.1 sugar transferase [Mesorhizobium sp.]